MTRVDPAALAALRRAHERLDDDALVVVTRPRRPLRRNPLFVPVLTAGVLAGVLGFLLGWGVS